MPERGDPLRHVLPGEPLVFSADAYNAMADAARAHRASLNNIQSGNGPTFKQTGIVKVKNSSGAARDRFEVLGIDTPLITPTANLTEFQRQVVLSCITPGAAHAEKFVILLEPLKAGAIGEAAIGGVTIGKIAVTAPTASYERVQAANGSAAALELVETGGGGQVLWRESGSTGTKWAILRLGSDEAGGGGTGIGNGLGLITRLALGTASEKSSGTTLTISSVTLQAGDLLLVSYGGIGSLIGFPNVTWNGISLTERVSQGFGSNALGGTHQLFINDNEAGTGNIVLTWGSTTSARAAVAVGVRSLPQNAVGSGATGTGLDTSPTSGASPSFTIGRNFLHGLVVTQGPSTDADGSWSNNFSDGQRAGTTGGADNTNITVDEGYRIIYRPASYAAEKTGITSRDWVAILTAWY